MKSSNDSLNRLSHHAYLLVGGIEVRDEIISILEKKHKVVTQGNPDFYIRNYETFTIDDAREVKSLHASRPVGGESKMFVLTMNSITIEAQNALLKLLEEPAEYARFFLIIPSAHLLLPTVKSRMTEMQMPTSKKQSPNDSQNKEIYEDAQEFLKVSSAKRLEIVKKLTDEISKEKKTKQDAIDFLNAVQEIVYKKKGIKEGKQALEAIDFAGNYAHDRAPSIKMLLEYVALNV